MSKGKQPSAMPCPLPKRIPKATKPFISNSSTITSSKSLTSTYDPTIRNLPDVPNPVLTPIVTIKKSVSGIPDKLPLTQAYRDELNTLLLKCKILNNTVCFYQERIKKLELECVSDDDNDNSANGELVKVI